MRVLSAALLAAVSLMQSSTTQAPTFRSRTDLVTVDVAVTQRGAPVIGLQIGDFELTDNGVAQRVELLDAAALPLDLTIVLDTSGSMRTAIADLRRDAQAIAAMLHPGDRLRLMTFDEKVRETMALQAPGNDLQLHELAAGGSTSLFDAVATAMIRSRDGVPDERRHLVIVLTDGDDTSSVLGLQPLSAISRRTDAVLYAAVSAPSTPLPPLPPPISSQLPPPPERQMQRRVWTPPPAAAQRDNGPLREAVENTGGVWDGMRSIARAPEGVRRALDWFRAAYVLRYRAAGVAPGGWHELRVRIRRGNGYDVRARRGYFGQ